MKLKVLSPSSINLYKQCPRKYFYQYILKLPTKPSIHLVRGSAVHAALEKFFEINPENVNPENYEFEMKTMILDFFGKDWQSRKDELAKLDMNLHDQIFYYNESKKMLADWCDDFIRKLQAQITKRGSLVAAFKYLAPITEKRYVSTTDSVQGFIDAIHHYEDGVHILDYKTSKKDTMTPAYRLQLAIYALLYQIEHGVMPKAVGIHFLKFGEQYLEVDQMLIDFAREEIKKVHKSIKSTDINDYKKHITGLCKWSTGQCDFYERCIKE